MGTPFAVDERIRAKRRPGVDEVLGATLVNPFRLAESLASPRQSELK